MKRSLLTLGFAITTFYALGQDLKSRPISSAEYAKAKTFTIKDLDKDTYAKFENKYVLDRYELRKPYFITGDDGLKKRIDLYKLITKDSMQDLGTVIYYTNEKGKLFTAIQPNFTSDGKVWEQYFEDIHAIDKVEKNFVLKLSYILSKEMSFQLYKAINNGKNLKEESATYGSDICFPGDQLVAMADGSNKLLQEIKSGDKIITLNPLTKETTTASVTQLVQHEAKNYAVTKLLVLAATEHSNSYSVDIYLNSRILSGTPNHPVIAGNIQKKISDVTIGDEILCFDDATSSYKPYRVFNKTEAGAGVQKVYNMEVSAGSTFMMNGVMVLQK